MKSWLRSLSLAACALMVAGCQSLYPPASGAVAAPRTTSSSRITLAGEK